MAGRLERRCQGVAAAVGATREREPDEGAVRAVGLDRPEGLEVDRHDPDTVLAGALGEELLGPGAEARDLVVGQERQLVATGLGEGPDGQPERHTRVARRIRLVAGAEHRLRRRQQGVEVDADERRWDEADIGQRRVSPADVRRVEELLAELVGVRDGLDALARVGDDDEVLPGAALVAVVGHGLELGLDARPGIGEEGVRLGRRARLGGDDHQRPDRVEIVERRPDVRRVGRVEDPEGQVALLRPERPMEDVRREAAAAHPRHDGRGVALVHDRVTEPLEPGDLLHEVRRRVEPAEALGDGLADPGVRGPQRHVTREQAVGPILGPRPFDGRLVGGRAVAEGHARSGERDRGGVGHRGLRGWSSMVRRQRCRASVASM